MSKIIVSHQVETHKIFKIFDVTDTKRDVDVVLFEFIPQDASVYLHADYLGNIYLKHINNEDKSKSTYYIVTPDAYSESGIELTPIKNPDTFRKNLLESEFLKQNVKRGEIKANKITLRGKAYKSINDMSADEKEEHADSNEFFALDDTFKESQYYWVNYKEDDKPYEGECDESFYINGAVNEDEKMIGIVYSDLLSLTSGTFDTILIQGDDGSKNVVSTVERIDGYCSTRLTFYTSGIMRVNFIDKVRDVRLCINPTTGELFTKRTTN
jgi:hypothetical protein